MFPAYFQNQVKTVLLCRNRPYGNLALMPDEMVRMVIEFASDVTVRSPCEALVRVHHVISHTSNTSNTSNFD